jgi:mRNA interferase MazF
MPNTTGFSFGDVVLVPFPFTDQTSAKKRPAIVVSSDEYHRDRPDVILMAVTSQVRAAAGVGECAVEGWREAGLLKPSVVKPIVATVHRQLVLRKLGTLRDHDRAGVRRVLSTILGQ